MSGNSLEAPAKAAGPRAIGRAPALSSLDAMTVALGLSALWLIVLAAYAAGYFGLFEDRPLPRATGALEALLFLLAAIAPPALFIYGAVLARRAAEIRAETARLSSAIDALRHSVAPRAVPSASELASALTSAARATLAEEKAALAAGLTRLDGALSETQAMMDELQNRENAARRKDKKTAPAKLKSDAAQPALPLETEEAPDEPIRWASVIRALDFPKDERDQEGFAALRETITDREFAELLQAAEDTLTLLSEEGLYMEDVAVDPGPLAVWRRYVDGARGPEVAQVGGVHDEVALAIARGKVKTDPVFRDAALHFIRRYDRLLGRMFSELGDDQIVLDAGRSRTGRAFMILARVMGAFDAAAIAED